MLHDIPTFSGVDLNQSHHMKLFIKATEKTSTPVLVNEVLPRLKRELKGERCRPLLSAVKKIITARKHRFAQLVWRKHRRLTKTVLPDHMLEEVLEKHDHLWVLYTRAMTTPRRRKTVMDPYDPSTYGHYLFVRHIEHVATLHFVRDKLEKQLQSTSLYSELRAKYSEDVIRNHWLSNREMSTVYCRQTHTIGTVFDSQVIVHDTQQALLGYKGEFNVHIIHNFLGDISRCYQQGSKRPQFCLQQDWFITRPHQYSCDTLAHLILFLSSNEHVKLFREILCKPVRDSNGDIYFSAIHLLYNI